LLDSIEQRNAPQKQEVIREKLRQGQKLAIIAIFVVFVLVVIVLIPREDSSQVEGPTDSMSSAFDSPEQPKYGIYNDPTDLGNIRKYYEENR
jgi:hypothetical protein